MASSVVLVLQVGGGSPRCSLQVAAAPGAAWAGGLGFRELLHPAPSNPSNWSTHHGNTDENKHLYLLSTPYMLGTKHFL